MGIWKMPIIGTVAEPNVLVFMKIGHLTQNFSPEKSVCRSPYLTDCQHEPVDNAQQREYEDQENPVS